jgi:hypothetical protein
MIRNTISFVINSQRSRFSNALKERDQRDEKVIQPSQQRPPPTRHNQPNELYKLYEFNKHNNDEGGLIECQR